VTGFSRWFGRYALWIYSGLALLFLLVPIAYTIVFSFNDSRRSNIVWRGFTLDNWSQVCASQGVCEAFGNSLVVGVVATVLATVLALVRFRFPFRNSTTLLLFLPMATPEVVLGAGLAAEFLTAGVQKGMVTVILAHTMFCISFVVVTVRARVASLDPALEEAGRDLYASPAQVFARLTLPLLLPGSIAEANVIASAVFIIALVFVVSAQLSAAARRKRLAKAD
jgi:spermidine/putrescine transport system permease protein